MGEDVICENNFGFYGLKISNIKYLDVGCNHPFESNNTYLAYTHGSRGVLIEPAKSYWNLIREYRPEDKLLTCAVGKEEGEQDFYILTAQSLNTLNKDIAEDCCKQAGYGNQKIEEVIKVQVRNINSIISENFETYPNLISIDLEGKDWEVLESLDLNKYRPEMICIEVNFNRDEIIKHMFSNGYRILGDNCLNIIFGVSK
jgi:FkbM family methyltransferase